MFLVITSVSEGSDGTSNFQLFDISVDGEYFCSLRYSQLRSFHMQLSKAFSSLGLPEFPPKKFGSLSRHQLEQRRLGIETYLRIIVHVPRITTSLLFKNFFLAAQFASWSGTADPISLAVHLLGGESVVLPSVGTLDREELVKERFTKKIGLRKNIIQFFTFHVAQQEEDGSLTMIRQLYPMESPVVTLYRGGPGRRLVFARKFWHLPVYKEVCENEAARDILFYEAVQAFEKGVWKCREADTEKLRRASQKKSKPEFLDLAAKQSDFLSTVIGGLTLEPASGKCNGAVILMRDSLKVSYRVRGGDTDGGYHRVLGKMNWSDIVSWSLVHQCQPSLRIKYKGPGPLNGQVSISGQSVPYLAQCIDAIIAMTTALKEAAVQKPEEEIPSFPKVTRAEIIWPPTSRPPLRARPQPLPPQEEQVTAGGGRLQQEQQGQCRPQQPLPPQQWQQQTRWSQQQLQQQLAQQQLLRQQQQQQQQLPSQQPLQLLPQQQMLPQQQLIPQQQQQLLPQQQQLLPQQQQQLLPQQPLQQLLPQQQQRQQQQLLPQQQRRQQQLSQQQLLPQQQQQLTQQPLQQLLPQQQQQQQQQLPQQQQLLPRQQQLLPQQPLQQLLPQQQQQQQLPQQQLSQQPLQQLLPQQQQQQQLSQQPLQQLLPQQQQQQQLSQQPLQQLLPQQQQQQQLSQQPLQQLLPQQQQQQQLSQQPLQQLLPQQQQQQLSQQPLQQLLPQQQQQQLSQQPLQQLPPQQQQQQQLSQQPLQQLLPQQQQEQEQSLEAVVTSSRRQRTQTF